MLRPIFLAACLCAASAARAQEGMGRLLGPPAREAGLRLDTHAVWLDRAEVEGGPERIDHYAGGLALRAVAPAGPGAEYAVGVRLARHVFRTDAVLPASGDAVPDTLWDAGLEAAWRRVDREGRGLGVGVRIASPGDRPFHSARDTVLGATVHYLLPAGDDTSWLLLLDYANRRSFLDGLPLPGVAWVRAPSRDELLVLGVPFSMIRTRLGGPAVLEASYFPPLSGSIRLGLERARGPAPYAAVQAHRDGFLRAGRDDRDAWLRHETAVAAAGLRWSPGPAWSVDVACTYTFARFLSEDADAGGHDGRLDLGGGPGARGRVAWRL